LQLPPPQKAVLHNRNVTWREIHPMGPPMEMPKSKLETKYFAKHVFLRALFSIPIPKKASGFQRAAKIDR
jgi:hypothetical protein